MSMMCKFCHKYYQTQISLNQHITAKHPPIIIVLDEHIGLRDPILRRFNGQNYKFITMPNKLRGQPDAVLINWAKQKGYGLMTRDKGCANKARVILKKVLFIE